MIIDHISQLSIYKNIVKGTEAIEAFLNENDLKILPKGRYELGETGIFILIQEYETKDHDVARWESHEKYIDIQLIIAGNEIMGGMPTNMLAIESEYNAEKDIAFYKDADAGKYVVFTEGEFAVFLPTDAHKPGCRNGEKADVKKAVIKIPV